MGNNISFFQKNSLFIALTLVIMVLTPSCLSGMRPPPKDKRTSKIYSWETAMAKATGTGDLLWMLDGEEITRIPLARMPNWKISDPEDIKSEWWKWDYNGSRPFNVFMKNSENKELVLGIDSKNIIGSKDLYIGAIAWTEFGWVDGTLYPSRGQGFDAEKKGIGFEGYLGSAKKMTLKKHVYPACVRVWGGGENIQVTNCAFTHVNSAVLMKAVKPELNMAHS